MSNKSQRSTKRAMGVGFTALAVLALTVPSCKAKKNESKSKGTATAKVVDWRVQGRVPQKMREVQSDPKLVAQGKALYGTCAGCHGATGAGTIGVGPKLNSKTFQAAASDDMLIRTIEKGRKGTTMVAFGANYKKEQLYALVAYIRSLEPTPAASLNEAALTGDVAKGGAVFRDVCSGCHGRNGAGYQETSNGTGIGRWAFLSNVSNGYLRYMIKNGKSGTAMRAFSKGSKVAVANLNNQQIDDVISYLRKNAW